MSDEIELSDGGCIEPPEENGDIRRRDVHGNMMDVRSIGDEGWDEWADLFGVSKSDYGSTEHTFDLTLDLATLLGVDIDGLNDLACETFGSHELQDIRYKVFGLKGEQIIIQVSGYVVEEDD